MRHKKSRFLAMLVCILCFCSISPPGVAKAAGTFPSEYPRPFILEQFVENRNLADSHWILVTKSDFTLVQYRGIREIARFNVAIGARAGDKERVGDMRTPEGVFRVVSIHDSKHWVHDFGDGEGPVAGAYGPWFIRLETGWKGIGIHGTHDPGSIGTRASEGCIRMKNEELLQIVEKTAPGTVVVIRP